MYPTNLSTYFARLLLIWFELLSDNSKVYFMSSQPYSQIKRIYYQVAQITSLNTRNNPKEPPVVGRCP